MLADADLNKVADAGTSNNLQQARGINNLGQIVGMVYTSSPSEIHGYLLTPR